MPFPLQNPKYSINHIHLIHPTTHSLFHKEKPSQILSTFMNLKFMDFGLNRFPILISVWSEFTAKIRIIPKLISDSHQIISIKFILNFGHICNNLFKQSSVRWNVSKQWTIMVVVVLWHSTLYYTTLARYVITRRNLHNIRIRLIPVVPTR